MIEIQIILQQLEGDREELRKYLRKKNKNGNLEKWQTIQGN